MYQVRRRVVDISTEADQPPPMRRTTDLISLAGLIAALALTAAACTTTSAEDSTPPATEPQATPATTTTAPTTTTSVAETTTTTPVTTTAASTTTTTEPLPELQGLTLDGVVEAERPVLLLTPPDSERRFIVQVKGTVFELDDDGALAAEPYLDLTEVVFAGGIEQGLLGLAFHPRFDENGRLFAYFTDATNDTHLVELATDADARVVDPSTMKTLISFSQPTDRHNAGMLEFGPDGYLYVALGEGGKASVHAQNPATLLSSILRIDVDGGDPYAIPADNPFADGVDGAPEVWAFGLRNPWRIAIDPVDRLMYIGDVGHEDIEEIDIVPIDDGGGYNFGWLPMEGSTCFVRGCDPALYTLPVHEYTHDEGCSITGGFVYRGAAIPEIHGHYFYADWCTGFVRSFRFVDGRPTDHRDWTDELGTQGQISSFGRDADGEMYILYYDGAVRKLVPVR